MKSFHLHVKVRNLLDQNKRTMWSHWKGVFRGDDGNPLTYEQVREALYNELTKGHEYIPLGQCDNFDYVNGGCKGHEQSS